MDKYVKLMPEFMSEGVWDREGIHMSLDDLPIQYWLKGMIRSWIAEYDRGYSGMEDGTFDMEWFAKQGYALAVKLKQTLPDWTVMYFDEHKMFGNNNRDEYIYEITLPTKRE